MCRARSATEISVVYIIAAGRRRELGQPKPLKMWLNSGAHEFVEMNHSVLHRGLVGAELIATLLVECTAAFRHAHADFLIFPRRFGIGLLLRLDEFPLEQYDIFRIIEFDDVG